MSSLFLLPVGEPDGPLLDRLRRDLQRELRVPTTILPERLDPSFAFHAERQQYHSTQILAHLAPFVNDRCWRIVGIASHDLYMPILTFVFGEAQLGGRCALVSAQRLAQPFYGLPPDDELTAARLLKETLHELGHTLDLTHCQDYSCVMASSHSVEWIDIKSADFCRECRARVSSSIPVKRLLGIF
jgi:archaemetzincin